MPESQNTSRSAKFSDGNREKTIRKVTWVGLLANVLLAGFKFLAGIIGSSQALVADARRRFGELSALRWRIVKGCNRGSLITTDPLVESLRSAR